MFLDDPVLMSSSNDLDVLAKALKNWTTMSIPSRVIPNLKHRRNYGWVMDLVLEHGNDNYNGLLDRELNGCVIN